MAEQTKTKKKAAPKKPAAHPTYIDMVTAAIGALKERNGSSRQAIAKYILANYKVDAASMKIHLRMALKRGVDSKKLVQPKGTGASGSFKLNQVAAKADAAAKLKKEKAKTKAAADKEKKAKKPAAKKAKKPAAKKAKKPAAKKASRSPKKAKKSEKKAAKPKKTKSPKKSKAKKPKKPKAKKASKSPKKSKK